MTIMTMMVFFTLMFISVNHPLSMGIILLFQTITIALQTSLINFNPWFSYIMFLILIGGMLVLFLYMTSVASNEKFSMKPQTLMYTVISLVASTIFSNLNLNSMSYTNFMFKYSPLEKYLNFPNNFIFIFLMIYLLIALIAVANISHIKSGPLRQKF